MTVRCCVCKTGLSETHDCQDCGEAYCGPCFDSRLHDLCQPEGLRAPAEARFEAGRLGAEIARNEGKVRLLESRTTGEDCAQCGLKIGYWRCLGTLKCFLDLFWAKKDLASAVGQLAALRSSLEAGAGQANEATDASPPVRRRGGERRLRHDLVGVVRKKHPPEVAGLALEQNEEAAALARSLVASLSASLPRGAVGDVAHAYVRQALGSVPPPPS